MKKRHLRQLDYMCFVGERVFWTNILNERFEGVIQKIENDIATLKLDNESIVEIEC